MVLRPALFFDLPPQASELGFIITGCRGKETEALSGHLLTLVQGVTPQRPDKGASWLLVQGSFSFRLCLEDLGVGKYGCVYPYLLLFRSSMQFRYCQGEWSSQSRLGQVWGTELYRRGGPGEPWILQPKEPSLTPLSFTTGIQSISQVPAGNRWHTQIGCFEESLIKGLSTNLQAGLRKNNHLQRGTLGLARAGSCHHSGLMGKGRNRYPPLRSSFSGWAAWWELCPW